MSKETPWLMRVPARVLGQVAAGRLRVILWPDDPEKPNVAREIPLADIPPALRMPNSELDIVYDVFDQPSNTLVAVLARGEPCAELERSAAETPDYIAAHDHSSFHRRSLLASEVCGCFYCRSIFPPDEITRWIDEPDTTALCPRCNIDAVIGSASGYPITPEFLRRMKEYWF